MPSPAHDRSDPDGGLLVVTGATGWVGRTAVDALQALLPPEQLTRRLRLFASREGALTLERPAGEALTLPVHPLADLAALAAGEPLAAVLHTAFLTRDRLAAVGPAAYISTNRWITQQVAEALSRSPGCRAVVISSGAAAAHDGRSDPLEALESDPYGVLKLEEERRLQALVPTLRLRLYALSGRFIREPARFALGDFLLTALRGEPIRLRAPRPVLRSYGHAGDITTLAWHWLLDADAPPAALDAVSLSLDLLSLASRIQALYGLPPVEAAVDPAAPPDRYVADPAPFLDALSAYGLTPRDLVQQLRDTALGLVDQSAGKLAG